MNWRMLSFRVVMLGLSVVATTQSLRPLSGLAASYP
jgi:hypothetical protein